MSQTDINNSLRDGGPPIIDVRKQTYNEAELAQLRRESLANFGIDFARLDTDQKKRVENGWIPIKGEKTD